MRICLVGGAVRDQLLGISGADRDWVVLGATPEQLLAQGFTPVGQSFPVFLHPQTKEEYALARTERKSGQGYTGFQCTTGAQVSLEDDLRRRDLTINAMALCDGVLIDPYGGQQDLEQRQLRHVSAAFSEDPLRVLRVARFLAKLTSFGFRVAEETKTYILTMVRSGELQQLTAERVWLETSKALQTTHPEVYFRFLYQVGALAILMPELARLFDVPQDPRHHPEGNVGEHTLMVLQKMRQQTQDVMLLWAALCHDLGKGVTPQSQWPKHSGHELAGVALVRQLSQRFRFPKAYITFAELVSRWHGDIHRASSLSALEKLTVFNACDVWRKPERFVQILAVCEADAQSRLGYEQREYPQKEQWLSWLTMLQSLDVKKIIQTTTDARTIAKLIQQKRLEYLAVDGASA